MCCADSLASISVSVRVRTCSSPEELRRSLDIYNEVWPRRAVTAEDVAAWRIMSVSHVELLGAVDGADAGSASASVPSSQPHFAVVLVTVLPQLRRRGAGSALFDASSAWAAEQGVGVLETMVDSSDDASLDFALHRGFGEQSREVVLELELATVERGAVDPPPGIDIVLLADRPELARGVYGVGLEALPDVPGSDGWTPPSYEQFTKAHLRGPAIFVALAADEVVAYAKLNAGADGTSAEHGMTAVKPAWRRRGIAQSLKRAQIAWAKENGVERLIAENDEQNVAMRHINEALGYRHAAGWIRLRTSSS
jgi:GNAT superfamily N-acetyltransferase